MTTAAPSLPRIWIDYSFARPDLAVAKKTGATGVIRYLCYGTTQSNGKILSPGERDAIFAAGLDLILNWEYYEGRCNEGAQAGHDDAVEAMRQAKALGYPKGACIYFSHDTGVNNWDAIRAYFTAVGKVLAGYYDVGGYSGYNVVKFLLDNKLIKYGWQTRAWSNGQKDARIVLFQDGNYWFGKNADEDQAAAYVDSWKQQVTTPTKPPPVVPSRPKPQPQPPARPTPVPGHRQWTVRDGDTLGAIAARFGTTVARLVQLNHLANPNFIMAGQVLSIDAQAPAPALHPTGKTYVVKPGDTLTKIARQFPEAWITALSLMRANHLPSDHIEPGQRLVIA